MAKIALVILLLGCCTCAVWSINDRLREVFSWRQVDFAFPDQQTRQAAIASGEYVQANNLPLGLEVWRDKLFITVPRWKAGVASTLNYVNLGSGSNRNRSPLLIPYPNYEMNRLPDRKKSTTNNRLIHASRMSVDECDRLWLVDMRIANGTSYGEPQLIIIDLKTDKVIRQFTIGSNLLRKDGEAWFVGVIADVDRKSCDRAFAYLPDIRWGLVVYSFRDNSAWRLEHHYFYFDPVSTVLRISGVRLEWTDGVFGLALSERRSDGYRTLYFQALASTRMFSVDTRVLQSNRSVTETFDDYHGRGHRPPGMQASVMSMDTASGAIFYPLINRDAVGCWNPRRFEWHSIDTTAVVAQDSVTLQYPSDLKVDFNSNLWVISNKMPQFQFRVHDMNFTNVNYRVFSSPVNELIKGTVCEPTELYTGNAGNYSYEKQGGSINNFPRLTTTSRTKPKKNGR